MGDSPVGLTYRPKEEIRRKRGKEGVTEEDGYRDAPNMKYKNYIPKAMNRRTKVTDRVIKNWDGRTLRVRKEVDERCSSFNKEGDVSQNGMTDRQAEMIKSHFLYSVQPDFCHNPKSFCKFCCLSP